MIFKIIDSENKKFVNSIWELLDAEIKCIIPCNSDYKTGYLLSKVDFEKIVGSYKYSELIMLND